MLSKSLRLPSRLIPNSASPDGGGLMARDPIGPPNDLDETGAKLYRKIREYLKADERWVESDAYLLGATCRYAQRARVAWTSLPRDENGRPVMTTGGRSEHSGEVAHPLVRIAETAERGFVDGLKELGLTPRAREQMKGEAGVKPPKGGKFGGRL